MFGAVRRKKGARSLLAAVFALALALRIAIPSGFMPSQMVDGIVVSICDGMGGGRTMVMDLQGPADDQDRPERQNPAATCAFGSLSAPPLAADPVQVSARWNMVLGDFALPPPMAFSLARADFLIPPLRGPPALA